MNDIRSLIPQNKFDIGRAEASVAAGYPAVIPILPELLEWLQDYNWPVARILAPFLASIGVPLVPYIQQVMNTDDEVWKYWIMGLIMCKSKELAYAFREELERMAYSPLSSEVREELDVKAQSVLEQHGWHPSS